MRHGWWWSVLVACGGGSEGKTPPSEETGTPEDTGEVLTTDTAPLSTSRLTGTVVDAGGGGQAGLALKLCQGLNCRNGETDASGGFDFEAVAVGWHAFEVVPPAGVATALVPLGFGDDEQRSLTVTMLPLDAPTPMPTSPTEVPAGEGLYITVSGADLEPPLFVDPATEVAGVRVPQAAWVPVDGAAQVLDMWYVSPFDHDATQGGLPARFDNLWGLADGDTWRVWVGSYDDAAWLDAGEVTVVGGELVGAPLLPLLSTVALVKPE